MRGGERREHSQAILEFALTLPIVLILVFGLIEFGLMLQAWITLQNSAQAGTRFAITGQGFEDPLIDRWDRDRLQLIKDIVRSAASSLRIDDSASPLQPGYFEVKVYASDVPTTTPGVEYPGGPEARVAVDVSFNHSLLTPVGRSIAPWVQLRAHSEMITERFRHPGYGTPPGVLPATIMPTPVRWYIAGYVKTPTGLPIGGVAMTGFPEAVTTSASGYYYVRVDDGWSGTVRPMLAPYTFAPVTRTYSNVGSDMPNQNYTGSLP